MTSSVIGSGWAFIACEESRKYVIRVCKLNGYENSVSMRLVTFVTIKRQPMSHFL